MKALFPVILLAALVVPDIFAQETSISGYATYVAQGSESVELGNGNMLEATSSSAVLIEDNTESPIHLMSQDCYGTNLFDDDATLLQSVGSCVAVDADGDIFWISFVNPPDGGTWQYTAGTGKFEGIEGGGTSEVISLGHGGQLTIRYEGRFTTR